MSIAEEKAEALAALRQKTGLTACQPLPKQAFGGSEVLPIGVVPVDRALGGGLSCQGLHEIAPLRLAEIGAASGFALALLSLAQKAGRFSLWIQQDFAAQEGGELYAPALALYGLDVDRLLVVRVTKAIDAFWAMEAALSCRGLASVLLELAQNQDADLTATRRLQLASHKSDTLALLLRQRESKQASAAATRWSVAALPGKPDELGGLGHALFDLHLTRNRQGACGRWSLGWNRDERHFFAAQPLSLSVASFPADRPQAAAG